MSVVRFDLAYDGTSFHGWARQPGVRTVEGAVREAVAPALGFEPSLSVAGRTDAGVHASGQVASFAVPPEVDPARADPTRLQRAANAVLAPEVVVLRARRAPEGFHARFSATGREYRYRVNTGPWPDPFAARFEWHLPVHLALTRMRTAARLLVGEHDFASFCRPPRPKGAVTVRNLRRLTVARAGDRIEVGAEANAFLHQMVRSLVGTLVAVGSGRLEPEAMPEVLAARDRSAAGPVAPPHGLTLIRVRYARPSFEL